MVMEVQQRKRGSVGESSQKKYRLGEDSWLSEVPSRGSMPNIWKDICSVKYMGVDLGDVILQGFVFKVNSGDINGWER